MRFLALLLDLISEAEMEGRRAALRCAFLLAEVYRV
jgi:hypothetical protein